MLPGMAALSTNLRKLRAGTVDRPRFDRHPGFAGWPKAALKALNHACVAVEFAAGDYLYSASDPAAGLYLLQSGSVELLLSDSGKYVVSHIIEPGGTIGLGPTVSGKPYEFTARAVSRCTACFVPRQEFIDILCHYPEATISVSHVLSSEVEMAYRRLRTLRG